MTWPARPPPAPCTEAELGRVLALDYGTRRVGVAISDALRLTAQPLAVIDRSKEELIAAVRRIVADNDVEVIVVGLPTGLSGAEGQAARAARQMAADVAEATGLPVELVDERFTTHIAERAMLEGGVRRRRRRETVDKVAAALILQSYLERQR